MIDGLVKVSGVFAASGVEIQPPKITFGESSAFGTYIERMEASGIVWSFAPCSMLGLGLWRASGGVAVQIRDYAWSPTVTTNAATGVITLLFTHPSYSGVSVTATLTPTPDGFSIGLVAANTNSSYGLEYVAFPRLGCKPHSGDPANAYLAHGKQSGCVVKNPHAVTFDQFLISPESPDSMQFWDYFDSSTKAHCYVSTDDTDFYRKRWNLLGDGSSVALQEWEHHLKNPRVAHNGSAVVPYTFTYSTRIALFRGLTEDGRCGAYDSAIRYRDWATDPTRSWLTDGVWNSVSSSVSSRIRTPDLFWVAGGMETPPTSYWSNTVTDLYRIKNFCQTDHVCLMLYSWGTNQGDLEGDNFRPPSFLPVVQLADMETALTGAALVDIHAALYTIPAVWDQALTGSGSLPFRYDGFIGTTNYGLISQYVLRDHDDNALAVPIEPNPPDNPVLGDVTIEPGDLFP